MKISNHTIHRSAQQYNTIRARVLSLRLLYSESLCVSTVTVRRASNVIFLSKAEIFTTEINYRKEIILKCVNVTTTQENIRQTNTFFVWLRDPREYLFKSPSLLTNPSHHESVVIEIFFHIDYENWIVVVKNSVTTWLHVKSGIAATCTYLTVNSERPLDKIERSSISDTTEILSCVADRDNIDFFFHHVKSRYVIIVSCSSRFNFLGNCPSNICNFFQSSDCIWLHTLFCNSTLCPAHDWSNDLRTTRPSDFTCIVTTSFHIQCGVKMLQWYPF